jgi:hypothetical protein
MPVRRALLKAAYREGGHSLAKTAWSVKHLFCNPSGVKNLSGSFALVYRYL